MASTRPNPASPSDARHSPARRAGRADRPRPCLGERRDHPAPSGSLRFATARSPRRWATPPSRHCRTLLHGPDAAVWVDLSHRPRHGPEGRRRARPPPAHRRGRPRGQPAGQDRDDRRRHPHRPVPPDLRGPGSRVGARLRAGAGVPADGPRRGLGPPRRQPPRSAGRPILRHGPDHLLWAIADDLVDGYFPFADRLGDAIDDSRTRSCARPLRTRSNGCSSSSAS